MPARARLLIESVFGEDAEVCIPEGLQQRHLNQEGERSSHRAMANFSRLEMDKGYSIQASHGWLDDLNIDIGTRLNEEPSITVTLVRQDDEGKLVPWVDAKRFAWELSQLQVRESLARRLPEWPQMLASDREKLIEHCPGLKFSRLWLAEESSFMDYNQKLGLHHVQNWEE